MQYLISFLEGIITFISPCLLPMLPIYLSYFAGGSGGRIQTLRGAAGFVCGFTVMFLALGALAGSLGGLLRTHQTAVNVITGAIVIAFGLSFMGILRLGFLEKTIRIQMNPSGHGFLPSFVFGLVFSIGWTPCVGAFLGAALLLASQQGSAVQGVGMLLCYSLGLGVPFLLSALVIDSLKGAFQWIKQHYQAINRVCGGFLVLIGLSMMTGWMSRLLTLLGGV